MKRALVFLTFSTMLFGLNAVAQTRAIVPTVTFRLIDGPGIAVFYRGPSSDALRVLEAANTYVSKETRAHNACEHQMWYGRMKLWTDNLVFGWNPRAPIEMSRIVKPLASPAFSALYLANAAEWMALALKESLPGVRVEIHDSVIRMQKENAAKAHD